MISNDFNWFDVISSDGHTVVRMYRRLKSTEGTAIQRRTMLRMHWVHTTQKAECLIVRADVRLCLSQTQVVREKATMQSFLSKWNPTAQSMSEPPKQLKQVMRYWFGMARTTGRPLSGASIKQSRNPFVLLSGLLSTIHFYKLYPYRNTHLNIPSTLQQTSKSHSCIVD